MKRTARKPSNLSKSLHRQLNSYALAASAAGVSLMALARPADAKIVYTKTHQELFANQRYLLDLNHDGVADFGLYYGNSYHGSFLNVFPSQRAPKRRSPNRIWGTNSFASALPGGVRIRADKRFGINIIMASCLDSCATVTGQWYKVRDRYLGLKFAIQGKIHYGWARLSVGTKRDLHPVLTGYAYETIPNKPIITGKTKGPDVITVQPATLGHLARGASAIPAWRQTK